MDYSRIARESFEIAWRYKSLWVFGLFAGGWPQMNFNFGDSAEADNALGLMSPDMAKDLFFQFLPALIVFMAAGLVAYIIATPALIDGVNRIYRGGTYAFFESFSRGVDFFWRFVKLLLLFFAVVFSVIAAFVLFGVLFVALGKFVAVLGTITLVCLFLYLVFVFVSVSNLAIRALVVRDTSVMESIREGYELFRTHKRQCAGVLFLLIAITIGLGIAVGMVALIAYFPINALVQSMTDSKMSIFVLCLLLGLPFAVVLGGFISTALANLYTIFYFNLVEPRDATMLSPQDIQPVTS